MNANVLDFVDEASEILERGPELICPRGEKPAIHVINGFDREGALLKVLCIVFGSMSKFHITGGTSKFFGYVVNEIVIDMDVAKWSHHQKWLHDIPANCVRPPTKMK